MASVVAGEIALRAGELSTAQNHWQRAADLLAPRLTGSRDWHLFDPAARVSAWLGHADDAKARIAQLTALGYMPVDPWPDAPAVLGGGARLSPNPN
jgi:hypothetical protein